MKTEKDKLKEFITRHRADFETDFPFEAESWKVIKSRLPVEKSRPEYQLWWKVAAVFLLVSTIGLLVERNMKNNELAYYESYVLQQEQVYMEMISDRKATLTRFTTTQQLPASFGVEIEKLDSLYNELKSDLTQGLHTDQLVDAMILNLQMRVAVLDRQIEILEQIQSLKKEKEEKYENAI